MKKIKQLLLLVLVSLTSLMSGQTYYSIGIASGSPAPTNGSLVPLENVIFNKSNTYHVDSMEYIGVVTTSDIGDIGWWNFTAPWLNISVSVNSGNPSTFVVTHIIPIYQVMDSIGVQIKNGDTIKISVINGSPSPTTTMTLIIKEPINTGISNIQTPITSFNLFPNPTTDFVNIESSDLEKQTLFRIYNLTGELVSQGHFIGKGTVNTSSLEKGTYIVQTNNQRQKFVKL